jgi:lipoprotein-releasing system permease protein
MEEYDKNFAIADIRFLRKLNQWPDDRIGGYEMFIDEKMNMDTVSAQIDKALPLQLTSQPISAIYPNIFDWLAIQNQTKRIVVITMLIVAIINLITCLLILVMERTRMVGVLKSLGMPDGRLNSIFWMYAGYIAFVGVGLGLLLGLGLVGLQSATHFISMDEATYYVSYAPVAINVWEVALVTVGSFAVCLLAVRLPLFYVQRISPIRAIRFA